MVADSSRLTRAAVLFLFFCSAVVSTGAPAPYARRNLLNKPAPEFALTDLNGEPLRLADFRGKIVLLNFWATWCAPCETEMPVFAQWQQAYGPGGLQVIGISMDDDGAQARSFVEKLELSYPVAMGNEHLGMRYGGVLGLPLTFLIDRKGVIRARFQGETDLSTIERRLKSLLSQP